MVKNLPTIERSTKIRFGKHATDDQAENTVVFNASNSVINAINEGSIYMAPLRVAELAGSNLVGYSSTTKELVDSSVPTSLLGGVTLDIASLEGNVVSNSSPHFANVTTAFTTGHGTNVGISNTSPTHMLSVGDKIFMSNTGTEVIKVVGNVHANRFFSGSDPNSTGVIIDGTSGSNKIQVSGIIKTSTLHADNIGIANTSPTHALSIGNEGQLRLNVPTGSIYALETVGNVNAQNYIGDGGLLSNVDLQTVTDKSNVTSNTLHLTNPTTSLKAYSNVIVDGTLTAGSNLYVNDTAANVLDVTGNVNVSNYLKTHKLEVTSLEVDAVTAGTVSSNIVGNNVNVITVTANVVADNVSATTISSVTLNSNVVADNVSATTISSVTLNSNVVADNVVATNISLTSVSQNDLLLGPAISGDALAKLAPYNTDATKKFLRSNDDGVAWDDVSSTLDAVASNGPAGANVTSNTIQFTNTVTSLTASGNVVVSGNVTTGTPITITSGGTGLNAVSVNELLLGPASGTALAKLPPYNTDATKKFLRSNDSGVEWDDVSSTLQAITTGGATTSDEVSFTNGVTSLTASGNVVATGNVTASIFKSTTLTSGKIPYVNNDNELIDSKVSFDTSTNVTSVASNLVVTGNLTVQGGTTFQSSNIHTVSDPIIELGNANAIDNLDMGIIMTRPTVNVVAGFRGFDSLNEYTIAYTKSDPDGTRIIPTYSEGYITANIWGNVLSGNVTSTGLIHGATLKGDGSAITHLNLSDATHTGLTDLISLGSHTTGNYVQSIVGGDGITASAASEGGTPTVEIDAKANGGLIITGANELAVDLGATSITGVLVAGDGGTGVDALASGELLYGSGSSVMNKLSTSGGSGKFLKFNGTAPVWADVSSNLESIVSNGPATANITSNTIQFTNTVNSLTASGNVVVSGNVISTGVITLQSSAGSRQPLRVLNAIKLDPASGAAIVPPSGMSSTTQTIDGIQYTSSASSTNSYAATNNAFDHNNVTIWRSELLFEYGSSNGTYSGANTTGSYSGEWIQLYRSTAIAPTSIQIIPAQSTFAGPSVWKVFGSTNGSSWTEIHSSTTIVPWNSGNGSTETITGSAAYNYLRLAINKSSVPNSVGTVAVSEVRFTGPPPPSNNVLSFNTTTGEIYDSGGQGGSSLANIIEEGSNVAIGPSAASANLTVNTYGSNVLTVSGNVSADNITIGGLNVAASPFALDDVVSVNAGANVTTNVLTLGGLVTSGNVNAGNVITTGDITISGNTTSQNIKLTNTDISATISSGTITIDAREKSYGTAPLVVSTTDVSNLVFSNLITGAQIVVPILASGGDVKISKELTNVNFYAMTTDVSITQDKHALMTLSNLYGNIYMNAIGFA